jgi:hypothetical protein
VRLEYDESVEKMDSLQANFSTQLAHMDTLFNQLKSPHEVQQLLFQRRLEEYQQKLVATVEGESTPAPPVPSEVPLATNLAHIGSFFGRLVGQVCTVIEESVAAMMPK